MNRRDLLASAGVAAAGRRRAEQSDGPCRLSRLKHKPVRIKNIENFTIQMPATPTEVEAGVMNRLECHAGGDGIRRAWLFFWRRGRRRNDGRAHRSSYGWDGAPPDGVATRSERRQVSADARRADRRRSFSPWSSI